MLKFSKRQEEHIMYVVFNLKKGSNDVLTTNGVEILFMYVNIYYVKTICFFLYFFV